MIVTLNLDVQRTIGQVVKDYEDSLTNLVYTAWNSSADPTTTQMEFRTMHKRLINRIGPDVYVEGLREGGIPADEMDAEDRNAIADWLSGQLEHVNDYAKAIVEAGDDEGRRQQILARLTMWVAAVSALGNQALMSARKNAMGTWRLGATERHCRTCAGLHGKRHRLSWYKSRGLVPRQPGSTTLECRGYMCDCSIVDDKGGQLI